MYGVYVQAKTTARSTDFVYESRFKIREIGERIALKQLGTYTASLTKRKVSVVCTVVDIEISSDPEPAR